MITYRFHFVSLLVGLAHTNSAKTGLQIIVTGLGMTLLVGQCSAQTGMYPQRQVRVAYANRIGSCPVGPNTCAQETLWRLPGYGGQPNPGKSKRQRLIESSQSGRGLINFSANWPAPFSVVQDRGGCVGPQCNSTLKPRPTDALNGLAYFKLFPNIRHDSGYRGRECDGYGYLGSSQAYRREN